MLEDGTGRVTALWFRFREPHLRALVRPGSRLYCHGRISGSAANPEILHPEVEPAGEQEGAAGRGILPVYPATEGFSQRTLRALVRRALEAALPVPDPLPEPVRLRLGLPGLDESLRAVHAPAPGTPLEPLLSGRSPWQRRLLFDELFAMQLALAARRRERRGGGRAPRSLPGEDLCVRLRRGLPFRLTDAQERVWGEVSRDLRGPQPMQRLLQGDVGSGKTVIATLAILRAASHGRQSALMAPTELLAEQHYLTLTRMTAGLGVGIALLTSGMPRPAREAALSGLASGSVHLAVGTHALLHERVRFARFGLAVVDEQHRFGVRQRTLLRGKGEAPDLLVMTATPIPRSLALCLYGDLDLSVIDGMPPGRGPVATRVLGPGERGEVRQVLREALASGRRAFVVCPFAEGEGGEDRRAAVRMAWHLRRQVFPGVGVGLVHGGMPLAERAAAMERFRCGATPLLVATTVIEVGLDVPEATVIVVEHAERFGLAQLHQLRGRVGRGPHPSCCLLLTGQGAGAAARDRLETLARTQDGFRIAEEDLRLRGPGDLLGIRQAGPAALRLADLVRDQALLSRAQEEARRLLEEDPELARPEHGPLRETARARGHLATLG